MCIDVLSSNTGASRTAFKGFKTNWLGQPVPFFGMSHTNRIKFRIGRRIHDIPLNKLAPSQLATNTLTGQTTRYITGFHAFLTEAAVATYFSHEDVIFREVEISEVTAIGFSWGAGQIKVADNTIVGRVIYIKPINWFEKLTGYRWPFTKKDRLIPA